MRRGLRVSVSLISQSFLWSKVLQPARQKTLSINSTTGRYFCHRLRHCYVVFVWNSFVLMMFQRKVACQVCTNWEFLSANRLAQLYETFYCRRAKETIFIVQVCWCWLETQVCAELWQEILCSIHKETHQISLVCWSSKEALRGYLVATPFNTQNIPQTGENCCIPLLDSRFPHNRRSTFHAWNLQVWILTRNFWVEMIHCDMYFFLNVVWEAWSCLENFDSYLPFFESLGTSVTSDCCQRVSALFLEWHMTTFYIINFVIRSWFLNAHLSPVIGTGVSSSRLSVFAQKSCFVENKPPSFAITMLASQKGRVRKRNSTLLTQRSSMWKLPMGASDTEFDRLSRKHPAVLRSIHWGYEWCTSDTDGILITTGFVATLLPSTFHPGRIHFDAGSCSSATQYFPPQTGMFWPVSAFWWQHCTFHPR